MILSTNNATLTVKTAKPAHITLSWVMQEDEWKRAFTRGLLIRLWHITNIFVRAPCMPALISWFKFTHCFKKGIDFRDKCVVFCA
jgi:hypothetical protein